MSSNDKSQASLNGIFQLATDLGCNKALEAFNGQPESFKSFSTLAKTVNNELAKYIDDHKASVIDELLPSFIEMSEALGLSTDGLKEKALDVLGNMPMLKYEINADDKNYRRNQLENIVVVRAFAEDFEVFPFDYNAQDNRNILASVLAQVEIFEDPLNTVGVGLLEDCFSPTSLKLYFGNEPISDAELEERKAEYAEKPYFKAMLERFGDCYNDYNQLIHTYHAGSEERDVIESWLIQCNGRYPVVDANEGILFVWGDMPFMLPLSSTADIDAVRYEYQSDTYEPPFVYKVRGETVLSNVRSSIHATVVMGLLFTLCN